MLRAVSLTALSLLAAFVAACGGGAASGEADPAAAVPADALVYAEMVVRPDGDLRADAEAAASKVLRTGDPGAKIRELVDKALAESGDAEIRYDRDIEPWLGDRIAFWVSGRQGDTPVAAVVAVTDADAAVEAVRKGKTEDGQRLTKRSYKGVDYEVDEQGVAFGIVGDFLVTGAEPELKRTIDADKGESSLAELDRYRKSVDNAADGRLAHVYVDLKRVLPLAARSEPGGEDQLRQLESLVPLDKLPPLLGAFLANGDRLAVDMSLEGEGSKALGALGNFGGGRTPLMQELPGDSWAALGAAKYGQQLKAMFSQYAGAFGGAAAKEQLKRQLGIDIDEDLLSWIGDVAVFARGDTVQNIDGGAVIQVTDKAKAEKGFNKLVGLLQSAGGVTAKPVTIDGAETAFAVRDASIPKPIVAARSAEKVVVAFGEEAAKAALSPSSKLGDAQLYDQGKNVLDDLDPSFLLSMPAVLSLAQSAGAADEDFEKARPYLEAYDVIALGYEGDSNGGRVRLAAGLK